MPAQLNHTIVHVTDAEASAQFLSEILGLPSPRRFGPFVVVDTANGVSLDFYSTDEPFLVELYAFLVSEQEFDEIFGRIQARGLAYWADPAAATLPQPPWKMMTRVGLPETVNVRSKASPHGVGDGRVSPPGRATAPGVERR